MWNKNRNHGINVSLGGIKGGIKGGIMWNKKCRGGIMWNQNVEENDECVEL